MVLGEAVRQKISHTCADCNFLKLPHMRKRQIAHFFNAIRYDKLSNGCANKSVVTNGLYGIGYGDFRKVGAVECMRVDLHHAFRNVYGRNRQIFKRAKRNHSYTVRNAFRRCSSVQDMILASDQTVILHIQHRIFRTDCYRLQFCAPHDISAVEFRHTGADMDALDVFTFLYRKIIHFRQGVRQNDFFDKRTSFQCTRRY